MFHKIGTAEVLSLSKSKVKVKRTLVQTLRLRTARRRSRGIALFFLDHGSRRGWGVRVTPPPARYPREGPGTHCTGGWVEPQGRSGQVRKISSPPDCPVRRQSLYQL